MDKYRLCYIEGNKAWFTDNFEKQWGDDWNDKPYECNAGYPYEYWSELIEDNPDIWKRKWQHHPIKLKTLYFEIEDWTELKACDMGCFSVEEINKGQVAWIYTDKYSIFAGTEINEFIETIEQHGGKIYLLKEEGIINDSKRAN